jgi:hypothetical protein
MLRLRFLAPLLVVGMFGSGLLLTGQDKKEPIIVSVRLPRYYSQLGLTPKQRTEILKIRGKYAAEIQELYQKISDLRDQEDEDCEKVLTDAQKARLRELRERLNRRRGAEDDDAPVKGEKKKSTGVKDKKKDTTAKDKKTPDEIKKPVEIKK